MMHCIKNIKAYAVSIILAATLSVNVYAQKVDYSVVSAPEETGIDFMKITKASDYVCMPLVKRSRGKIDWISNCVLGVARNGQAIAYLSYRNNTTNIFIKDIDKQGSSVQRTNRVSVIDFSFSPDSKYIVFTEKRGKSNQIFRTNADKGYICRQITTNDNDYTPVYSADMSQVFFARMEARGASIWSYNIANNFLSSLTNGMNPCPLKNESALLVARQNTTGRSEIWKINYVTGVEECIVSDPNRSFTSPTISPDGKWVLFVGDNKISTDKFNYLNTDIFVCHLDGTGFTQLTYHAADDISPVWSKDGRYIYFISQRGDAQGVANIWRMNFNY